MRHPYDEHGRFVGRRCPDLNCGGELQYERDRMWRCDGLTYDRDDDPLYACRYAHLDGYSPSPGRAEPPPQGGE